MSNRTFKVAHPHMTGDDISGWQRTLNAQMDTWQVNHRLAADGDFGILTRDLGRTVAYGLGMNPSDLDDGVTPALRIKIRNKMLAPAERRQYDARRDWRHRLRDRYEGGGVCSPTPKIWTHANGYSARHDGVDLITPARAVGLAICEAEVIRADNSGWWGLGAPSDPALRAKGDGICIIRSLVNIGPIKKGMNFGYGHGEAMEVRVGERVKAGERLCRAGFANAWHFHFMVNHDNHMRGIGDRDPWPIIQYAIDHQ